MKPCPRPEIRLTRFGMCHYYNFQNQGQVTLPGPQSSLIFYAGWPKIETLFFLLFYFDSAYNRTDTTTGALQFVDGITFFYRYTFVCTYMYYQSLLYSLSVNTPTRKRNTTTSCSCHKARLLCLKDWRKFHFSLMSTTFFPTIVDIARADILV